jgi:hypothetical protein
MTTPAAGWYPDPSDSDAWRWWDGATWTAHVRPKEQTAPVAVVVEPPAVSAPQPVQHPQPATLTPATPASEQIYWHSAEAEVIQIPGRSATTHSSHFGNGGGAPARAIHIWGEVGSPHTAGIWLLASLPLFSIALQVVLGVVFGVLQGATGAVTSIPNLVFYAILIVFAWVFAGLDIKALRGRGYEPPSIGWMLLLPPLVYFIKRGKVVRREGKRAWPPELLYFLSVVGIIGLSVAYALLIIAMAGGIDGLTAMAGPVAL